MIPSATPPARRSPRPSSRSCSRADRRGHAATINRKRRTSRSGRSWPSASSARVDVDSPKGITSMEFRIQVKPADGGGWTVEALSYDGQPVSDAGTGQALARRLRQLQTANFPVALAYPALTAEDAAQLPADAPK